MYKSRKALRLKPLASRRGVAKARAAAGLPPRRKGAQPGNDNRLIHGRYSRAFRARHMQVRKLLRDARTVIDELTAKTREICLTDASAQRRGVSDLASPSPHGTGADRVPAERNFASELQ